MAAGNNEQRLVQQLILGDPAGFSAIYGLYHRSIFQFVIKFVNSTPLAEDLTQEIFIKIWESRALLKEVRSFKAYLFTAARNHTLNRLKEIVKSQAALGEVIKGYVGSRSITEEELLDKEYVLFLKKTLAAMPQRTREIFRHCREHGRSYEEVAQELNISKNAVKNHMVRAMKILSTSAGNELGVSLSLLLFLLSRK